MRIRFVLLGAGALVMVMALAAACGGDGGGGGDGEEAGIRTQKGLSVAVLAAGAQAGEESDSGRGQTGFAPGVSSANVAVGAGLGGDVGVEMGRGAIAPDIAPFPFPSLQESQTGITVQGYGSASVDADGAVLDLYFSSEFMDDIMPVPEPAPRGDSEPGSSGAAPDIFDVPPPPKEITEADLQPVVDAIAAQGVSRDDIEVIIEPSYGDPYFGGSATVRVTVRNVGAVGDIVDAATDAASGLSDIAFSGPSVSYTVSDCASLEQAAMEAAVADAQERGRNFASVLGVGLGSVVGASSYSFSLFGGSPCDDFSFGGPYMMGGVAFAEGLPADVELIATVTVTFAIQ